MNSNHTKVKHPQDRYDEAVKTALQSRPKDTKPEFRFYEKSVYGNTLNYPENGKAEDFERLTGKKTATQSHFDSLSNLGFQVIINKANFEVTYY